MRVPGSRPRRPLLCVAPLLSVLLCSILALTSCEKRPLPPNAAPSPRAHLVGGTLVFSDDFERAELGPNWQTKHPGWALKDGALNDTNAKNVGAWLTQPLPAVSYTHLTLPTICSV